jgi:hypothetical protein
MYSVEKVQVRLFDVNDGASVIDAFNRIPKNRQQFRVNLYKSGTVPNDWSIIFWRLNGNNTELKSAEAICLAESLRRVGLVDHALWLLSPIEAGNGRDQLVLKKRPNSKKPQLPLPLEQSIRTWRI